MRQQRRRREPHGVEGWHPPYLKECHIKGTRDVRQAAARYAEIGHRGCREILRRCTERLVARRERRWRIWDINGRKLCAPACEDGVVEGGDYQSHLEQHTWRADRWDLLNDYECQAPGCNNTASWRAIFYRTVGQRSVLTQRSRNHGLTFTFRHQRSMLWHDPCVDGPTPWTCVVGLVRAERKRTTLLQERQPENSSYCRRTVAQKARLLVSVAVASCCRRRT